MNEPVDESIRALEARLWAEFQTDAVFPGGVPGERRLQLLQHAYAEIKAGGQKPAGFRYLELFPGMHPVLDFCTGWCPRCEILSWCDTAAATYDAGEIRWMREHNAYPPPF